MKCIHCQKELPDGALFCKYCGGKQDAAPVSQGKESQSFSKNFSLNMVENFPNTEPKTSAPGLEGTGYTPTSAGKAPFSHSKQQDSQNNNFQSPERIKDSSAGKTLTETPMWDLPQTEIASQKDPNQDGPVFDVDAISFPAVESQESSSTGTQVFDLNEAMQELSSNSKSKSSLQEKPEQTLKELPDFEPISSTSQGKEMAKDHLHVGENRTDGKQAQTGKKKPFVVKAPELQVAEAVSARGMENDDSTGRKRILSILWRVAVLGVEIGAIVWLWTQLFS